MNARYCIVIAWVEVEQRVVCEGRVDLGERHTFEQYRSPRALVWLHDGDAADLAKARAYAAGEAGHVIFTFPVGESDPLGRAKVMVMEEPRP